MKRLCTFFATIGLLTAFTAGAWADQRILDFDTMNGVDGPFLGNGNPIRGVNGGGLPWVIDRGRGKLDHDGKLDVEVRGLIIPDIIGFGFNPVPFFRVVVSCLSVDDSGLVAVVNVTTNNGAEVMIGDPRNGDARFKTDVNLPTPCVAPILFVTSPGGSWFSATGL
jgi:hypothetical protein